MQPQIACSVFIEPGKDAPDLLNWLHDSGLLHNDKDRVYSIRIRFRAEAVFKDLLRHIFHRISQHCAVLFMDLA